MKVYHQIISTAHKIPVTRQENQWVNIIFTKYVNNDVGQKTFCNIKLQ